MVILTRTKVIWHKAKSSSFVFVRWQHKTDGLALRYVMTEGSTPKIFSLPDSRLTLWLKTRVDCVLWTEIENATCTKMTFMTFIS